MILVLKIAKKTEDNAMSACNLFDCNTPIAFLEKLKQNNHLMQSRMSDNYWIIFSIDGEQDEIHGKSKYVILAKVFPVESVEAKKADKRRFHCVKCCCKTIARYATDGDAFIECLMNDYLSGWGFVI